MVMATVNRFIRLFDSAFAELSIPVSAAQVERLAICVHQSMDSKARAYHTAGHVFGLCEGMNPRQVLAALFHDVVYVQLDGGLPMQAIDLLKGVTRNEGDAMILAEIAPSDSATQLCARVFGFQLGHTLQLYGGLNEFLSAVLAARLLQPFLKPVDLLAVVACIEATIPFIAPDATGTNRTEALANRVIAEAVVLSIPGDTQAVANEIIRDAVALSNRDVGGFAQSDIGRFLSSTWLLIQESNAPLLALGIYSLTDYRSAFVRMNEFLNSVNPAHIFLAYDGTPDADHCESMRAAAHRNIRFACDFLDAKIVSIALIEALALCTGGNCPISMFLGDISHKYGKPDRIENFLVQPPSVSSSLNHELLHVFEKGRPLESSNDLTASPLTTFTYRSMGHDGTVAALKVAQTMFADTANALAFLRALPRDMVIDIARACSEIALSRKDALKALEAKL
jgi:hypothetical protein